MKIKEFGRDSVKKFMHAVISSSIILMYRCISLHLSKCNKTHRGGYPSGSAGFPAQENVVEEAPYRAHQVLNIFLLDYP